jgi:dihydroxyacetone kinase
LLTAAASELSDELGIDAADAVRCASAALGSVVALGGAQLGDKTMVDAAAPFVARLEASVASGASLAEAWCSAAEAARQAAEETAQMAARLGRARTHGEASLGTPDAGAVSFALIVNALGALLVHHPQEIS